MTDASQRDLYRCTRCGIESTERSCFVGITSDEIQRYAGTCITCNRDPQVTGTWRSLSRFLASTIWPIFFLCALRSGAHTAFLELLLAAVVMQPLILLLHELGHFLTAQLVGLRPLLITLGIGPTRWSGKILGIPIIVRTWPLLGLTVFDSTTLRFLRLRVWITVFMGPATNALLVAFAIVFWNPVVRLVHPDIVILWIIYNAMLGLSNLWPHRPKQAGQRYRSDGLQLLQLPLKKPADLVIYLSAGSIMSALALFSDGQFVAARDISMRGLKRLPANGRSEEALHLLEYSNYSHGTPSERGDREFARAFALRRLNRLEELAVALEAGLLLKTTQLPILRTIGLLPDAKLQQLSPNA